MKHPENSPADIAQTIIRNMRLATEQQLRLMVVVNCPGVRHVVGKGTIQCIITSDWTFGGITIAEDLFYFFMTAPNGAIVKFSATDTRAKTAATWFLDISQKRTARHETITPLYYEVPKRIWFIAEVTNFVPYIKKRRTVST